MPLQMFNWQNDLNPWRRLAGWYAVAILILCFVALQPLLILMIRCGMIPPEVAAGAGMVLLGSLFPAILVWFVAAHGVPGVAPTGVWARLGLENFRWQHVVTALKWFPLIYLGNGLLQVIWSFGCDRMGIVCDTPATLQVAAQSAAHFWMLAIGAVLLAPWVEEILLREWLFNLFAPNCGFWLAAIATSMVFASLHLTLLQFPCLFVLGLTLQLLYRHSGSVWPCIWVHFFNNLTSILLLYLLSAKA